MKWSTCTYTLTTTNSLSVKRQTNSVRMFRGLYGKNPKNTNTKISCTQEPRKKREKIHDSRKKELKRWSENGEKNGENLIVSKYKSSTAVITIMKGGKTAYILVDDLDIEQIQTRIKIATNGSMREKFGSYIFFNTDKELNIINIK